jgi:hypothetical protein
MIAPPVRRIAATIGLTALVPTGAMLAAGTLSPRDAAVRALVTLGACMAGARAVSWALYALADGPRVRGLMADRAPVAPQQARPTPPSGREEHPPPVDGQRGKASSAASTTVGSN